MLGWNFFKLLFRKVAQSLAKILPLSPFRGIIETLEGLPYLGFLNWFFPVGGLLELLAAWAGAWAVFHVGAVLLRWVKIIGG